MKRVSTLFAVATLALALTACAAQTSTGSSGGSTTNTESATAASVAPTAAVAVPNVVGLHLDKARDALKAAGITKITETDIRDGKSIWDASNWVVVNQGGDAAGVTLGVEKPQEKAADSPAAVSPAAVSPAAVSADGPEASARLEQDIKDALGVQSFSEILVQDASLWGGYINGVRVQNGLAYITLQVASDDPGSHELVSRAASALSTLLPASAVEGITWIIVQDASGTVIAQKRPAPIT